MLVRSVRTRFRGGHRPARAAPERMLEEHWLDIELVRLELVEDQLRVVGAVVVADTCVVASDDEVRAAVVLAADRVPDRLARRSGTRSAARTTAARTSSSDTTTQVSATTTAPTTRS